jgi:hypothetical protein
VNLWQRHDRPVCCRGLISCPLVVKYNYFSVSNVFLEFGFLVRHCLPFPPFLSFFQYRDLQLELRRLAQFRNCDLLVYPEVTHFEFRPWCRLSWISLFPHHFRGNAGIIPWASSNASLTAAVRENFCDSFTGFFLQVPYFPLPIIPSILRIPVSRPWIVRQVWLSGMALSWGFMTRSWTQAPWKVNVHFSDISWFSRNKVHSELLGFWPLSIV